MQKYSSPKTVLCCYKFEYTSAFIRASPFPRVAARHNSALLGFSRFPLELSQAPYVPEVVIAKSHDVICMQHKRNRIMEAVEAQPMAFC